MARAVCQRCLRPEAVCTCEVIQQVDNRTGIVILQHPAEHRHPLGTVRLARLGLRQVRHHVHWNLRQAPAAQLDLPEGTALLYPGEEARDLRALPAVERPRHLLVLDGTWSQARVLMAANPWLNELPKVRVEAARPSRYEDVRREPSAECVSTVEAIIEAIRVLEPELTGLDGMLASLEQMVARQQRFAETPRPRVKKRAPRVPQPVPQLLRQAPERVAVAYCETMAQRDEGGVVRESILTFAVRRLRGEDSGLVCHLRPEGALPGAEHLRELGITAGDLEAGYTTKEAAAHLRNYLGEEGVLAAWNQRALDRLLPLSGERPTLMLKGIYCNLRGRGCGHLEQVVEAEGLTLPELRDASRTARRLQCALSMAEFLTEAGMEGPEPGAMPR